MRVCVFVIICFFVFVYVNIQITIYIVWLFLFANKVFMCALVYFNTSICFVFLFKCKFFFLYF